MKLYICTSTDFRETTMEELSKLTGLKKSTVKSKIHDRPSDTFELKGVYIEVDMEKRKDERTIPIDFERRWNDRRDAAELIRCGQGKIVTELVRGRERKVTIAI